MSAALHDQPHRRGWLAFAVIALVATAAVALREDILGTPALILGASLVPVAVFAALILLVDRRSSRPRFSVLAAFLWSASIGAMAAQSINDLALRAFPVAFVSSVVAPFVEELAKGSALVVVLLVWRGSLRSTREGLVYGAFAGLGFAATENLGYYTIAAVQGGTVGLARALYLRGLLQGLNHAAFTAILGTAIGKARQLPTTRRAAATTALGFGVAVAIHAAWNGLASPAITEILCNAPEPGAACSPAPQATDLLFSIPALIALFIGPVALLLVVLSLRGDRTAAT